MAQMPSRYERHPHDPSQILVYKSDGGEIWVDASFPKTAMFSDFELDIIADFFNRGGLGETVAKVAWDKWRIREVVESGQATMDWVDGMIMILALLRSNAPELFQAEGGTSE